MSFTPHEAATSTIAVQISLYHAPDLASFHHLPSGPKSLYEQSLEVTFPATTPLSTVFEQAVSKFALPPADLAAFIPSWGFNGFNIIYPVSTTSPLSEISASYSAGWSSFTHSRRVWSRGTPLQLLLLTTAARLQHAQLAAERLVRERRHYSAFLQHHSGEDREVDAREAKRLARHELSKYARVLDEVMQQLLVGVNWRDLLEHATAQDVYRHQEEVGAETKSGNGDEKHNYKPNDNGYPFAYIAEGIDLLANHVEPWYEALRLMIDRRSAQMTPKPQKCVYKLPEQHRPELGFQVTSSQLVWGQLHTVVAGILASRGIFDGIPPVGGLEKLNTGPSSTILQWGFQYRGAARNGAWKVRRAFMGRGDQRSHFGWVLYHEQIDPLETLVRASVIGNLEMSGTPLGNNHIDRNVVLVNRYDWSSHGGRVYNERNAIRTVLNGEFTLNKDDDEDEGDTSSEDEDEEYIDDYEEEREDQSHYPDMGYLLAFDPGSRNSAATNVTKPFAEEYAGVEYIEKMVEKPLIHEGQNVGVFVGRPGDESDHEFAWLVYSGKKHADHKEADELVAIVYDGVYTKLEGMDYSVE